MPRIIHALLLLALVGCAGATPRAAPSPPAAALADELRALIRERAPDGAEVAVALLDLETGDSLLIDAHVRMHAASTMKVPVMVQLFRLADAGELDVDAAIPLGNEFRSIADGSAYRLTPADDSDAELYERIGQPVAIRELITRMIDRSSNLATNVLIELADPRRIAATLAELDAGGMHVLRGVEDNVAFRAGLNNTTTAYGLMKTMEAIARGRAASPAATEQMLEILAQQQFRQMIPAGVPPGTRVANKTGWITGIDHDAAIVLPAGRAPYVLVVLTRGFTDRAVSRGTGREISELVYERLRG